MSHTDRPKISAVLNTYNAAEHLDEVLKSLAGFDEIVLVDMHSDDDTRRIAAAHGARIVDFERCGICEPARNAAIEAASHPWVLVVDADELVTPQLRDYLYDTAAREDAPAALRIPRINSFMGREMHCLYPDYLTRFARKERIFWPPVIHAQPQIDGVIESIPASRRELAFVHLERNTIASRLEKISRYSAKEVDRRGYRHYSAPAFLVKPFGRFFRSYFLKSGVRDGLPGFIWALLEAHYKLTTMLRQSDRTSS